MKQRGLVVVHVASRETFEAGHRGHRAAGARLHHIIFLTETSFGLQQSSVFTLYEEFEGGGEGEHGLERRFQRELKTLWILKMSIMKFKILKDT